jgi:NTP pyrophosphatase (non-canonical NTP hydrolase)
MHLREYQNKAMSFRLPSADDQYALYGLSGEVGELHSKIAKAIRDDTIIPDVDIFKELGDILWFVAAIAADYDVTLEHIAALNIQKLASRSERGKLQGSGDER